MLENLFRGLFDSDLTSVISVIDFLFVFRIFPCFGTCYGICLYVPHSIYKKFCCNSCTASRSCLCCYFISEWKCGNWCCCSRRFQPCAFSFSTGQCKKEICTLFLAMGAGLITGMGYLGFAVLFTLVMCAMFMLYNHIDFGAKKNSDSYKIFSITIPEDLNYSSIWDDIFEEYTVSHDLICVKSTNMGSMFQTDLQYHSA